MAFKIAKKPQAPPAAEEEAQAAAADPNEAAESPEEEAQETPADEEAEGEDESAEGAGGGRILLDPVVAGYEGPENGPFMCGNCVYFSLEGPNTCHFVKGPIDHMGCCNLFKSAGASQEEEQGPDEGTEGQEEMPPDMAAAAGQEPPPEEEQ